MPVERVLSVVRRALLEDEFRADLFARPEVALADYDLTPEERAAVLRLKPEGLDSFVGGLVIHQFQPIRASRRFVIAAPDHAGRVAAPDLPILVGPEIVFGNGVHPSTQLCLKQIEKRAKPGLSVLDIGTGTGVLAIAAARLGAAPILALDIQAEAADAARRNIGLNGLADRIEAAQGSLADALARGFQADIVLGNLLAPVLIDLAGQGLADALRPGGLMVLSGLTRKQEKPVESALKSHGLRVVGRQRQGDWSALLARRAKSGVLWPLNRWL